MSSDSNKPKSAETKKRTWYEILHRLDDAPALKGFSFLDASHYQSVRGLTPAREAVSLFGVYRLYDKPVHGVRGLREMDIIQVVGVAPVLASRSWLVVNRDKVQLPEFNNYRGVFNEADDVAYVLVEFPKGLTFAAFCNKK